MTTSTGRRGRASAVLLGAVVLGAVPAWLGWTLVTAAPVVAHAYVVSTSPANGAELAAAPTRVEVTFQEPVTLSASGGSVSVLDSAGRDVGSGSVQLVDGRQTLVFGVRSGLAKDTYIASWNVVSPDTHPVGGSIQFGYGVPAVAATAVAPTQPDARLQLAVGVVKGLLYLALVGAFGLVPAGLVLGVDSGERRALWRATRAGVWLAVVASALQVLVQYLWDASATPGGPTGAGLWAFAGTSYSVTVFVRVVLLLAALAVVSGAAAEPGRRSTWRWGVVGLLAVAVLVTVVRNGHGGGGAAWQYVSTVVHVAAAITWLGGLAALGWLVLLRRLPGAGLSVLPRWSRYAAGSVGLIAATGVVQSVVQVRHPAAVLDTTYGVVLLVKLALVAVALLLGWSGNRWVRRQVAVVRAAGGDAPPGETARLRRRVRLETAVGAAVVIVSGVLSSTAPAAAAYAPRHIVRTAIGPYAVTVEIAPTRRGPESFRVTAVGTRESTTPVQTLQLQLGQSGPGVRALPVDFPYRLPETIHSGRPTGIRFVSSSVAVPATGLWTGTLTLVASPTEQYVAAFTYRVL